MYDTALPGLGISCYQITVCRKTHYFGPHLKCDICLCNPCRSHFGVAVMYSFLGDALSLPVLLTRSLTVIAETNAIKMSLQE